MKKEKKIMVGIISILTIVIVILSYFLINKNAIIEKQAEKIELQAMETNGSNSYVTTQKHLKETSQNIAKINEFKKVIANTITDMGITTPEDANAETMASNIRNIVLSNEINKISITITVYGYYTGNDRNGASGDFTIVFTKQGDGTFKCTSSSSNRVLTFIWDRVNITGSIYACYSIKNITVE